ncbi:galactose mutarotase-like domain-containing protein, partial [Pavlovales sp. CCMP2436]
QLVTLRLGQMTAKVSTYGATITSVVVPDCRGQPTETTLGFDTHEAYEKCPYYFGATIGRFANRIGQGSFFSIGGTRVQLPQPNDRGNTLHGGMRGWDKAVWTLKHTSATACTLAHSSPDGDAGFPGAVEATVTFSLEWGGRLVITYGASVSAATVLSLTNHAYFNLGATDGGERSDVLDHEL